MQPFSPGASIKRLSTLFSARQQLFQVLAVPLRHGGVCALFSVDVGISGKFIVAVTKPGLNVLQGIPQAIEDGRAAMPQIVIADVPQPELCPPVCQT